MHIVDSHCHLDRLDLSPYKHLSDPLQAVLDEASEADVQHMLCVGIDLSNDNIHNRIDGACARYLNCRKRYKTMPYALFVQGNSSENIKFCY